MGSALAVYLLPRFRFIGHVSLVIAGLGDLARPAEKISITQSAALSATGLVWARYSMVIIPKNYSLLSVNVFVALTGLYSLARAVNYEYNVKGKNVPPAGSVAS
ncbi:hypothetical protein Cfor_09935 [Coptotermes formosanus]|uniref:Mitochondrial pyruvate carrier n=1 Tax=Coptotermes formosanus TaxID=36987 RepID=A0A6L2PIN3_COPFO|nr:hypothetical protein Cfor_09935 [Coptotermes formosanus]